MSRYCDAIYSGKVMKVNELSAKILQSESLRELQTLRIISNILDEIESEAIDRINEIVTNRVIEILRSEV